MLWTKVFLKMVKKKKRKSQCADRQQKFWRTTILSTIYNHVFKHALHEVGHFLELTVGAWNVLSRERECFLGWNDSFGAQRTTRGVYIIRMGERKGPRRGQMQSQVVLVQFVRKASAFSPKIMLLSATLDRLLTTSCF